MITAQLAAKYIVQTSNAPVSNLKLQKLLYYAQGWSLGLNGTPLFQDEIQAWIHGPVVPTAFYEFRHFGWNPIVIPQETLRIDTPLAGHLKSVLNAYGKFSAVQLEAISHDEAPWIDARKGLAPNVPSRSVITHQAMKVFFRKMAHG